MAANNMSENLIQHVTAGGAHFANIVVKYFNVCEYPQLAGNQSRDFEHTISAVTINILTHLPPGQNDRHFADIFQCLSLNKRVWISLKISLKFVPNVRVNNIRILVQTMAWRQPGDKPSSEPILTQFTDAFVQH